MLFNFVDITSYNAWVIWKQGNPGQYSKRYRREFVKSVAMSLVKDYCERRSANLHVSPSIRSRAADASGSEAVSESENQAVPGGRGRCHLCNVRRVSRTCCATCNRFACPAHSQMTCYSCVRPSFMLFIYIFIHVESIPLKDAGINSVFFCVTIVPTSGFEGDIVCAGDKD